MEDNSLPEYLKLYISTENKKYLNKQIIHYKDINKNVINQLNLFESRDYYTDVSKGYSYCYSKNLPSLIYFPI